MPAAESHLLPVYSPPEQTFVRGEGCWIWDDKGERYLDCIAGIAVDALGHASPILVKALTEQAGKLWHTSNMFKIKGQEAARMRRSMRRAIRAISKASGRNYRAICKRRSATSRR